MIAAEHRFHGRASLRYVFSRGQVIRAQDISLRYVKNTRIQSYRMAVVVSRKVSKSAVVRNRIRRRIYEIVRLKAEQISEPYDLVFSVFSDNSSKISAKQLEENISYCLRRAGVIKGKS
jgi:ribonuclease P protein component